MPQRRIRRTMRRLRPVRVAMTPQSDFHPRLLVRQVADALAVVRACERFRAEVDPRKGAMVVVRRGIE